MTFRRRKHRSSIAPLVCRIERRVRFEEVDPLNIMWHGRYASWLEDGREALGKTYGMHYTDFYAHNVVIPLKIFHVDYVQPLQYNQVYTIETSLLWQDAALLEIEYGIYDGADKLMTTAFTTQLMVTKEHELLLEHPPFFQALRERWREGTLTPMEQESVCL